MEDQLEFNGLIGELFCSDMKDALAKTIFTYPTPCLQKTIATMPMLRTEIAPVAFFISKAMYDISACRPAIPRAGIKKFYANLSVLGTSVIFIGISECITTSERYLAVLVVFGFYS